MGRYAYTFPLSISVKVSTAVDSGTASLLPQSDFSLVLLLLLDRLDPHPVVYIGSHDLVFDLPGVILAFEHLLFDGLLLC